MGFFRRRQRDEASRVAVEPSAPAARLAERDRAAHMGFDEERDLVRERGSFAHGICAHCDWQGPGRRARSAAETDATQHRGNGCQV